MSLFNEAEADAIVAANVAKYKRQLSTVKELDMLHLYKGKGGKVYKSVSAEEITREDILELKKRNENGLAEANAALAEYDRLNPQVAQPQQEQPEVQAPQPANDSTGQVAAPAEQISTAAPAAPTITAGPAPIQ